MIYDLIVIGGGAAGFFAAIACAEARPASRILILEKNPAPLAKVRISGGGRCNLTHACYDPAILIQSYPRGSRELLGAFRRFQPRDTVNWFEARRVPTRVDAEGCIFPASDDSRTIINCLLDEAARLGVEVKTEAGVSSLRKGEHVSFEIETGNGDRYLARNVLVATGGGRTLSASPYGWAEALGHTIVPPVPSLFTFNIADPRLEGLAGVVVEDAIAQLPDFGLEQRGPLLVTHWGVSGPAVLKLSAWGARFLHDAHYDAVLRVNWLPAFHTDSLYHALLSIKENLPKQKAAAQDPNRKIPQRLWARLALAAGIAENQAWGDVSKHAINRLAGELTRGEFRIQGKGVFKDEFVTCGGINLKEVNFKTMESRRCPGLYFAGEILDIDGLTGGYNFQAAWTTGWLAGQAVAGADVV